MSPACCDCGAEVSVYAKRCPACRGVHRRRAQREWAERNKDVRNALRRKVRQAEPDRSGETDALLKELGIV